MVRARILEVEELTQSTKPEVENRDVIMYCILSLTYIQAALYPHGSSPKPTTNITTTITSLAMQYYVDIKPLLLKKS